MAIAGTTRLIPWVPDTPPSLGSGASGSNLTFFDEPLLVCFSNFHRGDRAHITRIPFCYKISSKLTSARTSFQSYVNQLLTDSYQRKDNVLTVTRIQKSSEFQMNLGWWASCAWNPILGDLRQVLLRVDRWSANTMAPVALHKCGLISIHPNNRCGCTQMLDLIIRITYLDSHGGFGADCGNDEISAVHVPFGREPDPDPSLRFGIHFEGNRLIVCWQGPVDDVCVTVKFKRLSRLRGHGCGQGQGQNQRWAEIHDDVLMVPIQRVDVVTQS